VPDRKTAMQREFALKRYSHERKERLINEHAANSITTSS
jgi:predicted GIY-YIG superfamily endonuclease